MLNAIPMVISKESFEQIFTFAEDNSALSKNLYNAALFRIRQVFTGWNKTKRIKALSRVMSFHMLRLIKS